MLERDGMEDIAVPKGELLTKKLNKLTPDTDYRFRMCAINAAGTGPFSEWATYRTANPLAVTPLPPKKLVCPSASVSTTSFEIKWAGADGRGNAVTSYILSLGTGSEDADFEIVYRGPKLVYHAKKLDDGKVYCVRVQAVSA
jgi:titin